MPRILIVEDSPTQALPIKFVLKAAKFDVDLAQNGIEALDAIGRTMPDLVLTDLQMPEMDGLRLVEAIRRQHPGLAVVLMTAGGSDQMFLQALQAGAVHYTSKQGLEFEIVDTLQKVLRVSQKQPAPQRLAPCVTQSHLRLALENDPSLIPAVVARAAADLAVLELDPTAAHRVGMALAEALANAIVRGNLAVARTDKPSAQEQLATQRQQESPYRERRVHVSIAVDPLKATFVVRDEGAGFNPAGLSDPVNPASLANQGGRGLVLMRTFMDEVTHNAAGNEVTLVKRRAVR